MSSPRTTPSSPGSPSRTGSAEQVRPRLLAYRVMAYVTGVFLLLLCASMVLEYGFGRTWLAWSAYAHGWLYMVYLVTVLLLGTAVRWRPGRMVLVMLAGTVPVMSFVAERRITRELAETSPLPNPERGATQ
jgi:integral membrane protein